MSIETIGDGLATRLETISGLRVYAPAELPEGINDPVAAIILLENVAYRTDMSANYEVTFRVIVLLTKQDSPTAFNALLDYIEPSGTNSVLAAIEADKTLSSTADTVRVVSNRGMTTTTWGGIAYLSTEFEVTVYA